MPRTLSPLLSSTFLAGNLDDHARDLGERWFLRWERALVRRCVQTLMDSGGLDVRVCDYPIRLPARSATNCRRRHGRRPRATPKEGRDGSFSMFGLTTIEIAATDLGGDDLIAIDAEDWPKLRVVLEVFFGVGERQGLPEAAAWLTRNGIGWSWVTAAPKLPRPPRRAPRPPRPSG